MGRAICFLSVNRTVIVAAFELVECRYSKHGTVFIKRKRRSVQFRRIWCAMMFSFVKRSFRLRNFTHVASHARYDTTAIYRTHGVTMILVEIFGTREKWGESEALIRVFLFALRMLMSTALVGNLVSFSSASWTAGITAAISLAPFERMDRRPRASAPC